MDFNAEVTKFPSAVHSHIYAYGRGIMPLDRTLSAVTDTALRESCTALHGFVTELLADLYDHPEAYHLPVMKLEEYCDGRELRSAGRECPSKIKGLLSEITHAAPSYPDLLRRIVDEGKYDGDTWVVTPEQFRQMAKRVKQLPKRLEALRRVGLTSETTAEGDTRFTSVKYPNIFPALNALPYENLSMFDFRNIEKPYKPTHDDYFTPLIAGERDVAYALHEFAMERKMRTDTSSYWKVNYKYKGSLAMSIGTNYDFNRYLLIRIIGKDRGDAVAVIDKSLAGEPQDFQKQAIKHLSGCDTCTSGCSTFGSGNFVTIMGHKHQMCGEGIIRYDWREPVPTDVAMMKHLLEIRCANIDEAQAAKKGTQ